MMPLASTDEQYTKLVLKKKMHFYPGNKVTESIVDSNTLHLDHKDFIITCHSVVIRCYCAAFTTLDSNV